MSDKHYTTVIQGYRSLIRGYKHDGEERVPTKSQIDRAFQLSTELSPISLGGIASEDSPVYLEASRLVEEHGFHIDASTIGCLTPNVLAHCGNNEIKALLYAGSLIVAEQEEDNGCQFQPENVQKVMIAAMKDLYIGKEEIIAKQRENASRAL